MIKLEKPSSLVSKNFRLSPAQVRQLALLGQLHGNQTRALVVAIERLYQDELRDNPDFAGLVADSQDDATDPPAE